MRSAGLLLFPIVYAPLLGEYLPCHTKTIISERVPARIPVYSLKKFPLYTLSCQICCPYALRTASRLPTPLQNVSKNPIPPSMTVLPALPCITAITGCLYLYDIPKSPRTASSIQRTYCTGIGSFSPSFSRAAAFLFYGHFFCALPIIGLQRICRRKPRYPEYDHGENNYT